jgi:hypothetical protein
LNKQQLQELLHAVEELYFHRRFEEAAQFIREVLTGGSGVSDADTRDLLLAYERKCLDRNKTTTTG